MDPMQIVREGVECQARFNACEVGRMFLGYDGEIWVKLPPNTIINNDNGEVLFAAGAICIQSSEVDRIGKTANFS